jgi:hypothetical protein
VVERRKQRHEVTDKATSRAEGVKDMARLNGQAVSSKGMSLEQIVEMLVDKWLTGGGTEIVLEPTRDEQWFFEDASGYRGRSIIVLVADAFEKKTGQRRRIAKVNGDSKKKEMTDGSKED